MVDGNPCTKGHLWLINERLKEGKKVWLAIRDVEPDKNNPWTAKEIEKMIHEGELKDLIADGRVITSIIPDIESVNYGRGVGYQIIEHVPPEEIGEISATKIREKLFQDKKMSFKTSATKIINALDSIDKEKIDNCILKLADRIVCNK